MSEGANHGKEANKEGEIPDKIPEEMTEKPGTVGDAEDPAEDMSEADIDVRMAAAKLEQEKLENIIRIQKKLQMLEALECENKRLQDELGRVESESNGPRSVPRVGHGSSARLARFANASSPKPRSRPELL